MSEDWKSEAPKDRECVSVFVYLFVLVFVYESS